MGGAVDAEIAALPPGALLRAGRRQEAGILQYGKIESECSRKFADALTGYKHSVRIFYRLSLAIIVSDVGLAGKAMRKH